MNFYNHSFDVAKWRDQDIFAQLGNVGSEVGRTFKWKGKGNLELAGSAFWRGLELLDETIIDPKNFKRGKELRRARELFCSLYFETGEYEESPVSFEEYFMQFARQSRMLHYQKK